MLVSDIFSEAGKLLGDPNNERWSQATLLTRLNIAQTKVLAYTNAIKTLEMLTPVVSTAAIQLDSDVIDIVRVWLMDSSGNWKKLEGTLVDQLDFDNPNWQNLSDGEPETYWWDGTNQKINLVPKPSAQWANANGIKVYEIQNPTDLTATTDTPFASNAALIPYHMALVYWVVSECFMDDGTPEALAKSKFHRSGLISRPGNFENEIQLIRGKFDVPEDIPVRILWRPTGGRASKNASSKSNPFGQ